MQRRPPASQELGRQRMLPGSWILLRILTVDSSIGVLGRSCSHCKYLGPMGRRVLLTCRCCSRWPAAVVAARLQALTGSAKSAHDVTTLSPDLAGKVKNAIHDKRSASELPSRPASARGLAARGESLAAFDERCIPAPPQRGCRIGTPAPAALLLLQILPVFSVVAPCRRGASLVSVRRPTFTTGCWLRGAS